MEQPDKEYDVAAGEIFRMRLGGEAHQVPRIFIAQMDINILEELEKIQIHLHRSGVSWHELEVMDPYILVKYFARKTHLIKEFNEQEIRQIETPKAMTTLRQRRRNV